MKKLESEPNSQDPGLMSSLSFWRAPCVRNNVFACIWKPFVLATFYFSFILFFSYKNSQRRFGKFGYVERIKFSHDSSQLLIFWLTANPIFCYASLNLICTWYNTINAIVCLTLLRRHFLCSDTFHIILLNFPLEVYSPISHSLLLGSFFAIQCSLHLTPPILFRCNWHNIMLV